MRNLNCAFVFLIVVAAAIPAAAQTPVFINEIHYDNCGTDTGEAIEIAGPAGTDLTGWSLVLYNGNGGAVYHTELSGNHRPTCAAATEPRPRLPAPASRTDS